MSKITKKLPYIISLLGLTFQATAASYQPNSTPAFSEMDDINKTLNSQESILTQIETDLTNLGAYLGYKIRSAPSQNNVNDGLYNLQLTITTQFTLVQNLYATLAVSPVYATFVANPIYGNINSLANQVFNDANSSDSGNSSQQSSSTKSLDSQPYTPYPVAQTLQNMLSITPDAFCFITRENCSELDWNSSCDYKYTQSQFYAKALGLDTSNNSYLTSKLGSGKCEADSKSQLYLNQLSSVAQQLKGEIFFPKTSNYAQKLLPQLDSSMLTSPLLYNNQESSSDSGSSSSSGSSDSSSYSAEFPYGLPSSNNQEAAENYVKYVTGSILPPEPAQKTELEKIAKNMYEASDISKQLNSFRELSKYILGIRVYAARVSVGIQNIYEILGARKKFPNNSDDQSQASSQALNEFKMATYRLYNPSVDPNNLNLSSSQSPTTWQQMINDASPARVQKETAILLAEINYQMYLMRKQQEKLLLTNSVMLLQAATAPSLTVPEANDSGSDSDSD
jgi:intracellular multiplication protein IcmX